MGLVDYYSRHLVGQAAIFSDLDNKFSVVQLNAINSNWQQRNAAKLVYWQMILCTKQNLKVLVSPNQSLC